MAESCNLTNRVFDAVVRSGAITSLKYRLDSDGTQFVLPGALFGEAVLTYCPEGGEEVSWFCNRQDDYIDRKPTLDGLNMVCEGYVSSKDGLLSALCRIELSDDRIVQTISLTNFSDVEITVRDAAFALVPNSSFEWGDHAGSKVIGHPFIGGYGSHSLITRCDGTGKYLLVLPYHSDSETSYRSGKWEFYDQGVDLPNYDNTKEQRSRLYVYELSAHESAQAVLHGYKERISPTSVVLKPGEEITFGLTYMWADSYDDARDVYMSYGIPDIISVPGFTVSRKSSVKLAVRGCYDAFFLMPQFPDKTTCSLVSKSDSCSIFELSFDRPGENRIRIGYGDSQYTDIVYFVTQSIRTMIEKRGAFIASHQVRDEKLWYNGLLAEWNNETAVELGPDNYDNIKGWRIYEVTCDDPGLSKPAFLSGKLAEYPVQEQVDALDYYIEHFVWGGLQCTEEEPYPYGIYGIPDWHANRNSDDAGTRGREHLWRIYDYPHIALMYFNMYRIAHDYSSITTKLSAVEYLKRACRTAVTMFTLPLELEEWSAYETGLYNELVIPHIVDALDEEGLVDEANHLRRHWVRKVKFFVSKSKDLFGSEYPFDTTGFESTHAFALYALSEAAPVISGDKKNESICYSDAVSFLENQIDCNIACRGYLEPTYYWYGSDYRANNHHYTLSYMSQMGGWAVLDYALRFAKDPYPLLRLGYGSLLSSWALMNCGEEADGFGSRFPGREHDGAASGGFEPLPYGHTWLEQPHSFGQWYYSCEIDLGFCGALRGACMVLADDPIFGRILYGGVMDRGSDKLKLVCEDGVGRRFHIVARDCRLHFTIDKGRFSSKCPIIVNEDFGEIIITIDTTGLNRSDNTILMKVESGDKKDYIIYVDNEIKNKTDRLPITGDELTIRIVRQ